MAESKLSEEDEIPRKMATLSDQEEKEEIIINENLQFLDNFLKTMKKREKDISPGARIKLAKFKKEWSGFFSDDKADSREDEEKEIVNDSEEQMKRKRTGARPKTKIIQKNDSSFSSSSEGSSANCSISSEDSEMTSSKCSKTRTKKYTVQRRKVNKTKVKQNGNEGANTLMEMMCKLDSRKVPPQEKFDESSGQTLKKYLFRFESYCESNFKGDRDFWVGELERHLSGKTLEAFKAMKDINDSYDRLKEKLLEWYNNLKELRKKKNRQKFKRAAYVNGEMLYLYSSRIEKLHRVAYPKHKQESSQVLRDKYVSTLPKASRKAIQSLIITHKLKDRKVLWSTIQKWARLQDLEREKDDSQGEKQDSVEEIVINLGRGEVQSCIKETKKYKDVATQDDVQEFKRYAGTVFYSGNSPQQRQYQFPKNQNYSPAQNYQRRHDQQVARTPTFNMYTDYNQYNNQTRHNPQQSFVRPSRDLVRNSSQCTYCRRLGHSSENCRTKGNLCYSCGSLGHYFKQCPRNRNRGEWMRGQEDRNVRNSGNYRGMNNNIRGNFQQRSHSQPRRYERIPDSNERQRRYSDNQDNNHRIQSLN